MFENIINHLRKNWKELITGQLIWTLLILLVLTIHYWRDIPLGTLTRDPNAIGRISPIAGFLSQLGIFIWTGAATICCIGHVIFKRIDSFLGQFWISSGLISFMLAFDDIFMVHDRWMSEIGSDEEVLLATYFLIVAVYLWVFRDLLLKMDYSILFMAFIFFACSIFVDIWGPKIKFRVLIEDGFKTGGQIFWLIFYYSTFKGFMLKHFKS